MESVQSSNLRSNFAQKVAGPFNILSASDVAMLLIGQSEACTDWADQSESSQELLDCGGDCRFGAITPLYNDHLQRYNKTNGFGSSHIEGVTMKWFCNLLLLCFLEPCMTFPLFIFIHFLLSRQSLTIKWPYRNKTGRAHRAYSHSLKKRLRDSNKKRIMITLCHYKLVCLHCAVTTVQETLSIEDDKRPASLPLPEYLHSWTRVFVEMETKRVCLYILTFLHPIGPFYSCSFSHWLFLWPDKNTDNLHENYRAGVKIYINYSLQASRVKTNCYPQSID